jgi:hypothetical protein
MTESLDMETEYRLIAGADFAADWVRKEVNKSVEWFSKEIHSGCVCDCGNLKEVDIETRK